MPGLGWVPSVGLVKRMTSNPKPATLNSIAKGPLYQRNRVIYTQHGLLLRDLIESFAATMLHSQNQPKLARAAPLEDG